MTKFWVISLVACASSFPPHFELSRIRFGNSRTIVAAAGATSSSPAAYSHEIAVARSAVVQASAIARKLQGRAAMAELVLQKDDVTAISATEVGSSAPNPVTVADFTVQVLVLGALRDAFPNDRFIAEECAAQLRSAGTATVQAVVDAVREGQALLPAKRGMAAATEESVCAALDLGSSGLGGWSRTGRTWVLDPIDGTKGFLRGDQVLKKLFLPCILHQQLLRADCGMFAG